MAHLTQDERFTIYEMNKNGYSSRYIGEKINRNKSTIGYELRKMNGIYRPDIAHEFALHARTNKKKRKLDLDKNLRKEIVDELKRGIAPDTISGRRKLENNSNNVSTETIYQFIYKSNFAKQEKLYLLLARSRKTRLRHGTRTRQKRCSMPNRVSINEREAIVRKEAKIGNLEGDLTFNKGNQSRNIGGLIWQQFRGQYFIKGFFFLQTQ